MNVDEHENLDARLTAIGIALVPIASTLLTEKPLSDIRLNISSVDLKRNPELKIIVAGHTDNVGDSGFNRELSQKRAEAVKAYMIGRGIDSSRLTARGYGDSQPSTSNETSEGRAKNRRVELRIH